VKGAVSETAPFFLPLKLLVKLLVKLLGLLTKNGWR